MANFPDSNETMTPAWLEKVLWDAGVLPRDVTVTGFQSKPVGEGMLAESVRIVPSYSQEGEAPASLIGKFPSKDLTSRGTGHTLGLYRAEVEFYRQVAKTVRIETPRCYHTDYDEATASFVLLLEDLAPARAGNQLVGGSVGDAERAMVQAAALHGPRWNDPTLRELAWMDQNALRIRGCAAMPALTEEFRSRYRDVFDPVQMDLCMQFAPLAEKFARLVPRNFTVAHMDFRLDNMLFDAHDGRLPLALVDWQTISLHAGAIDVAYYLGAGLLPADRAEHEERLLKLYLRDLQEHGVKDYRFDELWQEYRLFSFHGLTIAIFSAASTKRTERGDEMYLTMARGSCAQALETNALELLKTL